MKHLTTLTALAALLATTGCTTLRMADLNGSWHLNTHRSDVVPDTTAADIDQADREVGVPLLLTIYQAGDSCTITTRDSRDSVQVAHYRYTKGGALIARKGNPRIYTIDPRKRRVVLTDVAGHRLVFTKANTAL